MPDLNLQTLSMAGERVGLMVPVAAPVANGTLDVGLATHRTGGPIHPVLSRVLVVQDGVVPPLELYGADLRALYPRGGRVWLVVRYAGQLLASGAVQLVP